MPVLQEERKYQRILLSDKSEKKLEDNGFEVLLSSNVSAAAQRDKDLFIRFHNGSVYKYPNQGKNFLKLVAAASHGKWVWRFLRRPNKPYSKVGSLPLPEDVIETDEQIVQPTRPKYKVESIVPPDYWETGKLPMIAITPIEQAQATMGLGGLGAMSTMAMLAGGDIFGIINANLALNIIKGT